MFGSLRKQRSTGRVRFFRALYLLDPALLCLLMVGGSYAEPPVNGTDRSFPLPILTVDSANRGHCVRSSFTVTRATDKATPLSLAVIEDTPGGAGESVRASMWLAAMVAALDRMDPLAGTKVSLELSGAVDGPSAGAGICLAILSVLDGRDFPADCAVTGAIMPDGTIGAVGGLTPKLRAAAAAGLRRVIIPANIRFEKQPGVAEEVDLKRLAAELKLELIVVENITQGYVALHGLTPPARSSPSRSVLELPELTEEALKQRYRLHRDGAMAIWNTIPEADRRRLSEDSVTKWLFVEPQLAAENAYRTGRLSWAVRQAFDWHLALEAWKKHFERFANQKTSEAMPHDSIESNSRMRERLAELTKGMSAPASLLDAPPKGSEAGAQTWSDLNEIVGATGVIDLVQVEVDRNIRAAQQPDIKKDELKALELEVFENRQRQLLLMQFVVERLRNCSQERDAVTATLPLRPVVDRPDGIERLFYNAHLAARNTFRHDVVGALAAETQQTPAEVLDKVKGLDSHLTMYEPAVSMAEAIHGQAAAAKDVRLRRYALAVSAHLQAEALATQSALIVRWNHLEASHDEQNGFVYRRTDFLNYLISTARENALVALAHCREKDLTAISAITRFETGEMLRDDIATDKIDVLTAYWSASLQAKVLLMLCGSTKNGPIPKPAESASEKTDSAQSDKTRSATTIASPDLPGLKVRLPSTEELLTVPTPPGSDSRGSTTKAPLVVSGSAWPLPAATYQTTGQGPARDSLGPKPLSDSPQFRKWLASLGACWFLWHFLWKKRTNKAK